MPRIPRYEEQPQQMQTGVPQAPGTPHQALDLSGVRNVLGGALERTRKAAEEDANQRVRRRALKAQQAEGPGSLVDAPADMARRFQKVYREQALGVLQAQTEADTATRIAELRREHRDNPEGFHQAFQSFSEEYTEQINEVDPEAGFGIEQYLSRKGDSAYQQLMDAKFERDRQRMNQDAVAAVQDFQAAKTNELLDDPGEANFYDAIDEFEVLLDTQFNEGLIDRAQYYKLLESGKIDLATNYVWGEFNEAIALEDLKTARSLIDGLLYRGEWFDHNDRARALGRQLQKQLQGMLGAQDQNANQMASVFRDQIKHAAGAARAGTPVDPSRYADSGKLAHAIEYSTPVEQQRLMRDFAEIQLHSSVAPILDSGNFQELLELQPALDGLDYQNIPTQAREQIKGHIQEKLESRADAMHRGDPLTSDPIDVNFDFTDETALAEQMHRRQKRRQDYANFWDYDENAMPLFSDEELRGVGSHWTTLIDQGDFTGASEYLRQISLMHVEPGEEPDLASMVAWTNRLGDARGPMFLSAVLSSVGDHRGATRMASAMASGADLSESQVRSAAQLSRSDVFQKRGMSAVRDQMEAWSMGDSAMMRSLEDAFGDIYAHHAYEAGDSGAGEDAVKQVFNVLGDTVELSNGQHLPERYLGNTRTEISQARRALDNYLDDRTNFDLSPDQSEETEYLVPYLLSNGDWGFFHRLDETLMTDSDGQPVVLRNWEKADLASPSRYARAMEATGEGFGAAMEATDAKLGELADSHFSRQERSQVREQVSMIGGDTEALFGIQDSIRSMNVKHLSNRIGNYGLHREAVKFARDKISSKDDLEKLFKGRKQEIAQNIMAGGPGGQLKSLENLMQYPLDPHDSDQNRLIANMYLQHLQKKYSEPEEVYAAYFMGDGDLQELKDAYGDRWREELPLSARTFVDRMTRDVSGVRRFHLGVERPPGADISDIFRMRWLFDE